MPAHASVHVPEPSPRIRPGAASDLDALVELEQAAFTTDLVSRRSFRRFLASPTAALIVAEAGGRLAGYALVLFRPGSKVARLYSIAVASAVSGRGVGPMLLAASEAAGRRRRCAVLRLEVHEHNAAAINRYRKSGYNLFGRHLDYYDDHGDALRFEKQLGPSSTGRKLRKESSSPAAPVAR